MKPVVFRGDYHKACTQLRDLGECNFKISDVARYGRNMGVPKVQSLRNSPDFVALIKAFRNEAAAKAKPKRGNLLAVDAWIDDILDPRLRLLVREQSSENYELRQQIKEMKPIGNVITVRDISKVFSELSPVELRSLHYIQSNEFLKDHNMKEGDRGEVVDSNGEIFFPIGTLKAVRKVLNSN